MISTRSLFPLRSLNDSLSPVQTDISISTEKLKKRLREEGINENLVKDCEQIMLSEFSEIKGQLKSLYEERSNLLDTLRQLEVICMSSIFSIHYDLLTSLEKFLNACMFLLLLLCHQSLCAWLSTSHI